MSTILMTGASRGIGLHAARKMLDERPDLRLIVVARGEQHDGILVGGHPAGAVARCDRAMSGGKAARMGGRPRRP